MVSLETWSNVAGVFFNVVLSGALVILYYKMKNIQDRQTDLMERDTQIREKEYLPDVIVGAIDMTTVEDSITANERNAVRLQMRNDGYGIAKNIEVGALMRLVEEEKLDLSQESGTDYKSQFKEDLVEDAFYVGCRPSRIEGKGYEEVTSLGLSAPDIHGLQDLKIGQDLDSTVSEISPEESEGKKLVLGLVSRHEDVFGDEYHNLLKVRIFDLEGEEESFDELNNGGFTDWVM